jgi:GT2 family glycosyltransferase
MPSPRISVVIPTIGRNQTVARALERLGRQRGIEVGDFEVVLAIDAAEPDPDAASLVLEGLPCPTRRVVGGRPGASGARNAGWRAAEAPLILFMDDDVLADPRLVAEHLSWHDRHPRVEVGVLGHVRWARELRVTPFMRWLDRGIQFDYGRIEGIEAGWGRFYTANASLKRSIVERVGGFDEERLPFGYEDLDIAYRMNGLGFRLLYNRRAEAEHLHAMDLAFYRRRVRRIAASEREFIRLHPEMRPYFHDLFASALAAPEPRGRGARLAPYVPTWVPVLGPRVWSSVDAVNKDALANDFMAAWNSAQPEAAGPDLSERVRG